MNGRYVRVVHFRLRDPRNQTITGSAFRPLNPKFGRPLDALLSEPHSRELLHQPEDLADPQDLRSNLLTRREHDGC